VNVHDNARLTPTGRALLVRRVVEEGWAVARAAEAALCSARTGWKWLRRWRQGGVTGLRDRSSRPHRMPRRLPRARRRQILRLRRQRQSSLTIAAVLGLPLSTVGAELRRSGLQRLPPREPPPPVRRYERARPGELVHVDTKKLGRFWRPGHRIPGYRHHRNPGAGWEVLYVAIDDATRLLYAEVLADELGTTAAGFFQRAQAWLATHGILVERWMTDNGSPFVSRRVRALLASWQARHLRTRPYTPRTNGKAERVIQTLLRDWAYARAYGTSGVRRRALVSYLRYYNTERRHTALNRLTPLARLVQLSEQRL
jgi:transposase InsO family protein